MNLSAEDVAAAEAVGCSFHPVPAAQHSRFAMQRKVFHVDAKPVLVTRGGGLYETAATLSGLLELGRERIRAGLVPPSSATPTVRETAAELIEAPTEELEPITSREVVADEADEPKEPLSKRMRRGPRAHSVRTAAPSQAVKPSNAVDASENESLRRMNEPAPVMSPARQSYRTHASREPKWMTAGARRRGRASVHWSTRQK